MKIFFNSAVALSLLLGSAFGGKLGQHEASITDKRDQGIQFAPDSDKKALDSSDFVMSIFFSPLDQFSLASGFGPITSLFPDFSSFGPFIGGSSGGNGCTDTACTFVTGIQGPPFVVLTITGNKEVDGSNVLRYRNSASDTGPGIFYQVQCPTADQVASAEVLSATGLESGNLEVTDNLDLDTCGIAAFSEFENTFAVQLGGCMLENGNVAIGLSLEVELTCE